MDNPLCCWCFSGFVIETVLWQMFSFLEIATFWACLRFFVLFKADTYQNPVGRLKTGTILKTDYIPTPVTHPMSHLGKLGTGCPNKAQKVTLKTRGNKSLSWVSMGAGEWTRDDRFKRAWKKKSEKRSFDQTTPFWRPKSREKKDNASFNRSN